MKMKYGFALVLSGMICAGCSLQYKEYYEPCATTAELMDAELLQKPAKPVIAHVDDWDFAMKEAYSNNYFLIGKNDFLGDRDDDDFWIGVLAESVGATAVIANTRYETTTVYGEGDTIPPFAKNLSETKGKVVPKTQAGNKRSKDWYAHKLAYMSRRRTEHPNVIGMVLRDLAAEEKGKGRPGRGVEIHVVMAKTPAFYADLFHGDVLLAINNIHIDSAEQAARVLRQLGPSVKKCTFRIWRDGTEKNMVVDLDP